MKLNVTLDEKNTQRFQEIKAHSGMQSNPSIIKMLISQEYSRIERSKRRRVFLPNQVYDDVEKAAKALNLTIDEYVDSVTDLLLKNPSLEKSSLDIVAGHVIRKANEGLKHGKN